MLKFSKDSRVLVVAPHVDDETHCGGTVNKLSALGCEIASVSFSYCKESLPDGFSREDIVAENEKALGKLGVPAELRFSRDFQVRWFHEKRQWIMEELVRLRNDFEPTVVLCPASADTHQDHRVVYEECERAFRRSVTLLGYLHPLNMRTIRPNLIVGLENREWAAKLEAWHSYASQRVKECPFDTTWLEALCRVWGFIGCPPSNYAEAFEVIGGIVE